MPVLLSGARAWECPNCDQTDYRATDAPLFHNCRGLRGLSAPMVPAGTRCKVVARDREDYVGADEGKVQTDGEGRPVMSIQTVRDDGTDLVVLAPVATLKGRA